MTCLHHCSYSHLQMRSVERVFKFIDLPSEEPKPRLGQRKASTLVIENPDACTDTCWPNHGQMDIRNLTVKYTEAGHAVLKNLSFSVEGGQKVCMGAVPSSVKETKVSFKAVDFIRSLDFSHTLKT